MSSKASASKKKQVLSLLEPLSEVVATSNCIQGAINFLNTKTVPGFGVTDVSNVYPKLIAYLEMIGLKDLHKDGLLENTIAQINFAKKEAVKRKRGEPAPPKEDNTIRPVLVKTILKWSKYYDPNTMLVDVSKLRNILTITNEQLTEATHSSKKLFDPYAVYYRHASDLKTPVQICDDTELKYLLLEHPISIKLLEKATLPLTIAEYQTGGKYQIHRQMCANCWLCSKNIHIYRVYDTVQCLYVLSLNTACGDDEHVLPPGIGNLLGTLESDKKLTEKLLRDSDYAKFGLESSHSKDNTCKGDIVLLKHNTDTGMLEINEEGLEEYLTDMLDWLRTGKGAYPSYELHFSKQYSPMPHEDTINEMRIGIKAYLTRFLDVVNKITISPSAEPAHIPQYNNILMLKIRTIFYGCSILNAVIKAFDESWGIYPKHIAALTGVSSGGSKPSRMIGGDLNNALDQIMNFDITESDITMPEACPIGYQAIMGEDKSTPLIGLSSNLARMDEILDANYKTANLNIEPTGDINEWIRSKPEWLATDAGFTWLQSNIGWLSTPIGHQWLNTEFSVRFRKWKHFMDWVNHTGADSWLSSEYCYLWTQTADGLMWINTSAKGIVWIEHQKTLLPNRGWLHEGYCYPWMATQQGIEWRNMEWISSENGQNWLQTSYCYPWLDTPNGREWLSNSSFSFTWAGTRNGLQWLLTDSGKKWLGAALIHWIQTPHCYSWLETSQGLEWLRTPVGDAFLKSDLRKAFVKTTSCYPWLESTQSGKQWIRDQTSKLVENKGWFTRKESFPWFATDDGLIWLSTHLGQQWIHAPIGILWLETEHCYCWISRLPQIPPNWMRSSYFSGFVDSSIGYGWLMTVRGQRWLTTTVEGNAWLNSQNSINWITETKYYAWFSTTTGVQWLALEHGRLYLQQNVAEFVKTPYCHLWLTTKMGKEWFTRYSPEWIMTEYCYPWLATDEGLQWICANELWITTPNGQQWLTTEFCYRWLLDPRSQPCSQKYMAEESRKLPNGWLGSDAIRQFLAAPSSHTWLTTEIGQQWLTRYGPEWIMTEYCYPWLATDKGLQFISEHTEWLLSETGQQWLTTEFCYPWLMTNAGLTWLTTVNGQQWLTSFFGNFVTTHYCYPWFHSPVGNTWLSNEWAKFGAGHPSWFKTEPFYKWLLSDMGKAWLPSEAGNQWLTSSFGKQWFRSPVGQAWVTTLDETIQATLRTHLQGGKRRSRNRFPTKRSIHHKHHSFSTRKHQKSRTSSITPLRTVIMLCKGTRKRRFGSSITHKDKKSRPRRHTSRLRSKRRSTRKNRTIHS